MPFVKVGSVTALLKEKLLEAIVEVPGGPDPRRFAICNVEGAIHVVDGICPHRGGWLGQGALHGKSLVCPWHAWEFDCTTGECEFNPRIAIAHHTVQISGDDILVDLA